MVHSTTDVIAKLNAGSAAAAGSDEAGNGKWSVYTGKVRDRYELEGSESVVMVATDRLSGFDRQLAVVPFKGQVLNLVSLWWFEQTKDIIKNHVISSPDPNVAICRRAKVFPIEFVVRGYITGSTGTSLWTNYNKGAREYCGIKLPEGLKKNDKLWQNLITPTTKDIEHDEPISPAEIVKSGRMTQEEWDTCSAAALKLFAFGQEK